MPRAPKSCANPLFYAWVQEFHDEKDYRKRGGPPRATGYENALRSIEVCSTKYAHPRELLVLNGVGPTCVERLTEKLKGHCTRRGIAMPEFKKKERVKKAAAAPKKAARRSKKRAEDEEDSDADFSAPSSSKAKTSKADVSEDEENLPPARKRAAASDGEDYVGAAPTSSKRRSLPRRASVKRPGVQAVLAGENSESEE